MAKKLIRKEQGRIFLDVYCVLFERGIVREYTVTTQYAAIFRYIIYSQVLFLTKSGLASRHKQTNFIYVRTCGNPRSFVGRSP
jgi:hypothetical protein